jgi:hypothetical protein
MREIKLRLKPNHLLVFAVRNKKMMNGIIIATKGFYADHHELMAVWIGEMGEGCNCLKEGIGVGAKCYVLDTYELGTDLPFEVAATYGPKMPFKEEILEEARRTSGKVEAFIIHENSLVAMEESSWKRNPVSSWEQLPSENLFSQETSGTAH